MSDIAFETFGRVGLITFTRPKALNALSGEMIAAMGEALDEWARDDRVERVVVRGEGKAFCAGGDVRFIHDHRDRAADYFASEYRNNFRVAQFPKPYLSLIDGIAMGGGVGVSAHGSHKIGTERMVLAMPEVAIGLVPDVGTTSVLAALPNHQGRKLAMTGARVGRDEAAALGLVTHPVSAEMLEDVLDRASEARELDPALDELVVETEPPDEAADAFVDKVFSAATVGEILNGLDQASGDLAQASEMAATIRQKCPTSVRLAFEAQKRLGDGDVADALRMEFRLVCRILEGADLFEGIRAVLIDKDNAPRWSPASLDDLDEDEVEAHFVAPERGDLDLPEVERDVPA